MIDRALRIAKAAEECLGTPFRLHGRDPKTGLDCIGLITSSLAKSGINPPIITGYSLRNLEISRWLHIAGECGFAPTTGEFSPGDLLLLRISPVQAHCGVISESKALIHAHAGLARVVRTPMPLQWPVEHHWRFSES